jgi:hypothetical protein
MKNLHDSEESLPAIVLLDLRMPVGLDVNIAAVGSERIWMNSVIENRSSFAAQWK